MYKFADGNGGCYSNAAAWTANSCAPQSAHNNAYGFDVGGGYHKISADVVYQHYDDAISVLNPLLGPQSVTQTYQFADDIAAAMVVEILKLLESMIRSSPPFVRLVTVC